MALPSSYTISSPQIMPCSLVSLYKQILHSFKSKFNIESK